MGALQRTMLDSLRNRLEEQQRSLVVAEAAAVQRMRGIEDGAKKSKKKERMASPSLPSSSNSVARTSLPEDDGGATVLEDVDDGTIDPLHLFGIDAAPVPDTLRRPR